MFKEVLANSGLTVMALLGLVIFFASFLAILVWTLMRPRTQVDRWSRVPLEDEPVDPIEPVDPNREADRHG